MSGDRLKVVGTTPCAVADGTRSVPTTLAQPADAVPVDGLGIHPTAGDAPLRRAARLVQQERLPQEVSLRHARDLPRTAVVRVGRVVPEHEIFVRAEVIRLVAGMAFT